MPSPVFMRLLFSTTTCKELLYQISLKYAELLIMSWVYVCGLPIRQYGIFTYKELLEVIDTRESK
jgi:hypothetical protein